jgi:hypothetical protein
MKLDEIEKLIAAASPGPWPEEFGRSDFPDVGSMACGPIITADEDTEETQAQDDQDFICMARELMPKLLKVVKASECRDSYTDFKGKNTAYCKRCDYCLALADLEQP